MLWTIFVILAAMWLLGMVSSYTMGGAIHILLVLAVIVVATGIAFVWRQRRAPNPLYDLEIAGRRIFWVAAVAGIDAVEIHRDELTATAADGAAVISPVAVALNGCGVAVRRSRCPPKPLRSSAAWSRRRGSW